MGLSRSDITVEDERNKRAVIIETKRSKDYGNLKEDSEKALNQIEVKEYAWDFQRKGYEVTSYGIAFAEKECLVTGKSLHEPAHHPESLTFPGLSRKI